MFKFARLLMHPHFEPSNKLIKSVGNNTLHWTLRGNTFSLNNAIFFSRRDETFLHFQDNSINHEETSIDLNRYCLREERHVQIDFTINGVPSSGKLNPWRLLQTKWVSVSIFFFCIRSIFKSLLACNCRSG